METGAEAAVYKMVLVPASSGLFLDWHGSGDVLGKRAEDGLAHVWTTGLLSAFQGLRSMELYAN